MKASRSSTPESRTSSASDSAHMLSPPSKRKLAATIVYVASGSSASPFTRTSTTRSSRSRVESTTYSTFSETLKARNGSSPASTSPPSAVRCHCSSSICVSWAPVTSPEFRVLPKGTIPLASA